MDDATLERFADLAVGFGANVQPDQIVAIGCEPGKEYLVRALAASAYRHGAKFVDVGWFDPHVKRARDRARAPGHARLRAAVVRRARARARRPARRARRALRAERAGPARRPRSRARRQGPAAGGQGGHPGRQRPHDELDDLPLPDASRGPTSSTPTSTTASGLARLEQRAAPRPAARRGRPDRGLARARGHARGHRRAPDRAPLRRAPLRGPGHRPDDRPAARRRRWHAARFETVDGIEHMPNLPTEEVFTTPDPERTEGIVTSTKPLVLIDGTVVRDLVVRFEGGRVASSRPPRAARRCTRSSHRRRRRPPRRGRARRPRGPHRRARHDLLRHAARRERGEPHRARPGLPVRARRGRPRRARTSPRSTSTS